MLKQITSEHYHEFNNCLESSIGIKLPHKYFSRSKCFAYFKDNRIVAGFIISPYKNTLRNFRTFEQIRKDHIYIACIKKMMGIEFLANSKAKHLAEYTGYFILDKSIAFIFTLKMIVAVCLMPHKYFFISYSYNNKFLKNYYSKGKPEKIVVTDVEYHTLGDNGSTKINHGIESIEVLSKYGVVRIFIWRTMQVIKKWMIGLSKNLIR